MSSKYEINSIHNSCKNCKTKFRMNTSLHIFCSSKCRYLYSHPSKWISRKCEKCNGKFETNIQNKKYCSQKCRNIKRTNKHRERSFVQQNRGIIIDILGYKCTKCNSLGDEIHHTSYNPSINKKDKSYKNIKKYCKTLLHLCWKCHKKITLPL